MATRKARTDEEKKRDQNKRLLAKYGIDLTHRDELAREQNNFCKICHGPLDAYGPPCVDHYHFYIKVDHHFDDFLRENSGWDAQGFDERGQVICVRWALTKDVAKAEVKKVLMPWSVRGLLCFKCNRGLGSIERFFNAARYPDNLLSVIEYLKNRLKKS